MKNIAPKTTKLFFIFVLLALVLGVPVYQGATRHDGKSQSSQENTALLRKVAPASAPLNPGLSINGQNGANITVCSSTLSFSAFAIQVFHGTLTYIWTLERDGSTLTSSHQSITCDPGFPCQFPSFSYSAAAVSGSYRMRLTSFYSDEYSNQILVTATPGDPQPKALINGSPNAKVYICPGGPITLDGSQSTCATAYFLSMQLSDEYWNGYGVDTGKWLTSNDFSEYGPIKNFNVKKFFEDRYFQFVAGQYYRVKLAVGPRWYERTQLIWIRPPTASFTINGSSNLRVDSIGLTYPISMNGSGSSCATSYFVSIQLSDQYWNGYGVEVMKWLTPADLGVYGPIKKFNVKKFAEDRGVIFRAGQYYRVKLAVGPVWNESTKLVYMVPFHQ